VDCPYYYPGGKPHGVNKIVTAHPTLSVGGVPVAVQDCVTECGCKSIGTAPRQRGLIPWSEVQWNVKHG
jgi:uncharacterized Zn-binding protein involved in type VI secretion